MNIQLCSIRIETLGCRLNQTEAESFAALCTDAGFSIYTSHADYAGYASAGHTSANDKPMHYNPEAPNGTHTLLTATASAETANSSIVTAAPIRLSSALPPEQTVLCFVNTCTVTGKAEQKARRK